MSQDPDVASVRAADNVVKKLTRTIWIILGIAILIEVLSLAIFRRELLASYGEALALLAGVTFYMVDQWRDGKRQRRNDGDKKKLARYWVMYNAINRIGQDISVLKRFRKIFGDESVSISIASDDNRRRLRDALQSFSEAWKNDDVINDTISLEFSLLTTREKEQSLVYFEKYNTLEDEVWWIKPKLDHSSSDLTTPEKETVMEGMERLRSTLHETIEMAFTLADIFIQADKEDPDSSVENKGFPGFKDRIEHHRTEYEALEAELSQESGPPSPAD